MVHRNGTILTTFWSDVGICQAGQKKKSLHYFFVYILPLLYKTRVISVMNTAESFLLLAKKVSLTRSGRA